MKSAPSLDAEVIVVGGGPAGAATAWALARSGIDVLVLDRAVFPRDKPCAEYLSPQASPILAAMGALEEIERSGAARLAGMLLRAPDGGTVSGEFATARGFSGSRDHGLSVRRLVLDEILLRSAARAGARVEQGVRVTDVTRDGSGRVTGVVALVAGAPKTLRARIVVGADGLRSVVGRRLGLVRARRWPRRIGLVTHYRGVRGMTRLGEIHSDRDGYFGLTDVGHGITNVGLVVPTRRAAEVAEGRTEFVEDWIAERPHLAERFAGAERVTEVRATGPFASTAKRAHTAGAVLVGDAADYFDPFTGEGIFVALRGGELLAPFVEEAIRHPGNESRAFAAYEAARRAEFRDRWKMEWVMGVAVAFPSLLNHAARVLSRRGDMVRTLFGVAGGFLPPREILAPRFLFTLFAAPPPSTTIRS